MVHICRRRPALTLLVALVASSSGAATTLRAQSTLDGDVTRSGHPQVALDALSYVATADHGGWLWLNPRAYLGLSHGLEVGGGLSYYSHPSGGQSALQPSIKWQAVRDTVHGFTLAAGAQSLVSLAAKGDSYGFAFLAVDHALPHSERGAGVVSVGSYTLVGRARDAHDDTRGVIVTGWESVGALRVSGSWISGRNFYGYRTGSVTWTSPSGRWVGLGYSQGNASWHNSGPFVSTGRAF